MTATHKIVLICGGIVVLITAFTVLTPDYKTAEPIVLSYTGVSASSNSSLISIVISNPGPAAINYLVEDPELKFNGFWRSSFPFPSGRRMDQLRARQSASRSVTIPSTTGEARIPVLWGFQYSPTPSKWRQLADDFVAFTRTHNLRGRGALYTNYVEGITLR